jgi:hypothetical protein
MPTHLAILLALVFAKDILFTPQLAQAASTNKAKILTQKNVPKQFSAANEFRIHSMALRALMLELYQCNPETLGKNTGVSKEEYVQWVFEGPFDWKFDAIRYAQSTEALTLSFNAEYQGDHVLPFITGLYTMLLQAYGGENEFTFTESINPQKLTIAAKNIEISTAKLLTLNQNNSSPYLNDNCNKHVKRALDDISKHIDADYRRIAKNVPSTTRINPF